ncbi:MAG: group 1 hemoglobin, partial [Rhizobacter sp.]|nr:group 1 hemoglobin [Rhizobacter sp.]
AFAVACIAAASLAARAQTAVPSVEAAAEPMAAASAVRPLLVPYFAPDAGLLQTFGGKDGIFKLADVFVDRMRADARIGHYFEKTRLPLLKTQLGDHLCQVLAGPCVYDGDSMKASHADLGITKADSVAQVEILQDSMRQLGIPVSAQNRLLDRLAPMFRDVITR